jgi:hypothetical protein
MFALKHKPTGKYLYEDEGGSFLIDEKDLIELQENLEFLEFEDFEDAEIGIAYCENKDDMNDTFKTICADSDTIYTEEGDFPTSDFEVVEIIK